MGLLQKSNHIRIDDDDGASTVIFDGPVGTYANSDRLNCYRRNDALEVDAKGLWTSQLLTTEGWVRKGFTRWRSTRRRGSRRCCRGLWTTASPSPARPESTSSSSGLHPPTSLLHSSCTRNCSRPQRFVTASSYQRYHQNHHCHHHHFTTTSTTSRTRQQR